MAKIPRLQPYFLAKIGSFSSLFNLQSNSINFNFGHFWPKYQGYSLTFQPQLAHFHHFSISNQNQSISISVNFGQNTKAIALLFGQNWLIFITFQSPIKINQFQFRSFLAEIPRLQPYFLATLGSFSSLFNLQSKSINFNFGHFWPKARLQPYFLAKIGSFSSLFNLQSNSINFNSVIFGQNTKAIALLFSHNWLIFITFQSPIKINQFQFRSILAKIPRLQPYFLAKIGSFSSLFNLQSKSITFNFGHFWPKYQGYSLTFWPKLAHFHHFSIFNQNKSLSISVIFGQNTKAIALLLGQNWLIFITFNLQSKSINFNFGHLCPKYQGYRLTFQPQLAHFHHFSISNQNQSISISVILWPKYQGYSITSWPKLAHFHHLFNLQSKSINFNFGHFWPKYQGYSLTFWPKLAHFHHFSISNQNQSISISVIFGRNTKAIALLFSHNWLIFITFQSSIKINQFQFRSFLAKSKAIALLFGQNWLIFIAFQSPIKINHFQFRSILAKYQGYSLTIWPKLAHFHHFSISNQNQSISISVIFGQNTKAIDLLFSHNWLIFITFQSPIKINQFQFRSILAKIPRLQPYFLAKIGSFSSLFNLQSKSINFNFGHFWPKYQGYSLTSWPKLAHFHHFSISNQNQSISISVNFGQNTKAIALLFGQNWLIFITFQSPIKINQISISVIFGQNTKAIALLLGQNWLIFITFQSPIKINQFQFRSILAKIPRLQPYFLAKSGSFSSLSNLQSKSITFNFGQFWPKYQGYSLTIWQNWLIFITFQSPIKINQFQFRSCLAKIPRLQPYFLAKIGSFSSLFNLQSKSITFNFGHFWPKYQGYSLTFWPNLAHFHHFLISNQNQSISISVIFGQNTKAIALLLGHNWLNFITFQSPIKINQFQFRSFLAKLPRLQPYFLAKIGSFSSLFNLQSKSINFNFGHFVATIPRLQPYFLAKIGSFSSLFNLQSNQSISIRSFLAKLPRLQPYFLAKIGSFSSLFNLQSKSINFNFGHIWPKYQGYSLTFWPKLAHVHHFSISNQNQSISISVIFGQNTKAIALLFGQNWLIFITFQSPIKINHFQFRSFLAKIPRLQPYFLAKIGSISSLFNLQSKSINFNFRSFVPKIPRLQTYFLATIGSFSSLFNLQSNQSISISVILWPKYQGYSLTSWPTQAHFHHFSISNQNQSISISVIFGQLPRLQPYFLAKIGSFSSLVNLQSKSINFNFGHFWPKYQGYQFWPKSKAIALVIGQK